MVKLHESVARVLNVRADSPQSPIIDYFVSTEFPSNDCKADPIKPRHFWVCTHCQQNFDVTGIQIINIPLLCPSSPANIMGRLSYD